MGYASKKGPQHRAKPGIRNLDRFGQVACTLVAQALTDLDLPYCPWQHGEGRLVERIRWPGACGPRHPALDFEHNSSRTAASHCVSHPCPAELELAHIESA
eukprot:1751621-Prymnesium_polylepis.1